MEVAGQGANHQVFESCHSESDRGYTSPLSTCLCSFGSPAAQQRNVFSWLDTQPHTAPISH